MATVELILQQLALNKSIFIQFILFGFCVVFLSQVVFKDYLSAFEKREESTKGGEQLASEIIREAQDLQTKYETQARAVSGEVKTIFDEFRDQASKESEKLLTAARAESQKIVEETRKTTFAEIEAATKKLAGEVPAMAAAITQRLLAK